MREEDRLKELNTYNLLDTLPESGLDELTRLASIICETPISLISIIDDHRQWFKSKVGLDIAQTPRQDSFCQHAIHAPKEVLVVENPLEDERFKSNPLVLGNPNIRFYAGAPLETPSGNVLGTLCIIDNKPRQLTENQKQALQLLAKMAMDYLNTRKTLSDQDYKIDHNREILEKLTDHLPGAIYQFEVSPEGKVSMPFISKGITEIHSEFTPDMLRHNLDALFTIMHPDDLATFRKRVQNTIINPVNGLHEFRIISEDGVVHWLVAKSKFEKKEDGTIVWYGILREVTERKEYVNTLEQILFDISHVMRRPAANLKGLVSILESDNLNEESRKEIIGHIKTVSQELDSYIHKLNEDYYRLQERVKNKDQETSIP